MKKVESKEKIARSVSLTLGARTRTILQCIISSKMCSMCLKAEDANTDPKSHSWSRYYSGSLKAMEVDAALEGYELFNEIHNRGCHLTGHIW